MGWQDRDYAKEDHAQRRPFLGRGRGWRAYDVTTKIIIANAIIFFLPAFIPSLGEYIYGIGLMQAHAVYAKFQVWRLFTATYLHAGFAHIFINMLLLYFVGPALEQRWGGRQFFWVYTFAGIAGNVILTIAGAADYIDTKTFGLGASGSVLSTLGAAAVLFPHAEVYVYFLFPVKIRTFVIVYALWYAYNVYNQGTNYGGDICHLAGLAVGVFWAYRGAAWWDRREPLFGSVHRSARQATFKQRVRDRQQDQATVDRILEKVYNQGVHSLSPSERRTLTEATDRLRQSEVG